MSQPALSLYNLFAASNASLTLGDAHAALELAHKAWSLAPDNADCINLIGVCAMALGDGDAAERCWLQAIAIAPAAVEAHFNLAQFYLDNGRALAEPMLRQTIALQPHHVAAHMRLAGFLMEGKRSSEAEELYRRVLQLQPDNVAAHIMLGVLLAATKRGEEAESCYRKAMKLAPQQADAPANLALLLECVGRYAEAEQYHLDALKLQPDSVTILSNYANLLGKLERHGEAENSYRTALSFAPESAIAHANLGVLLAHLQRDSEAEQHLRQAFDLNPASQRTRLNLAMLLLTLGRLEEGWPLHEARHHPDLPDPDAPLPSLDSAQWQGESLSGKSLLVWPEQGYGDMIQFCRYLPELKRQEARNITLVCRAAQVTLLRTLAGVDQVIALDDWKPSMGPFDYWTLPMSLPLHAGTGLDNIPAVIPYLHSNAERRALWRTKLPPRHGKKRVGLMWRGNPHHANDDRRSLPEASLLAPLLQIERIEFFSLQINSDEIVPDSITDLGASITDFADTAAILQQLDLLITVDTAAAHLAGALGVPCWIMLPAYRTDWRWMRNRADSPWYPETMRLCRQQPGESWHPVIARMAADLALSIFRAP